MKIVAIAGFMLGTALVSTPASAANFFFSTGEPDGLIGTATRPDTEDKTEVETGDDFLLTEFTTIDEVSFAGLLLGDSPEISELLVEVYRVFPQDSQDPPSGQVPTRENSPSDIAFQERELSTDDYSVAILQDSFTVANTVIDGINPSPNQTTGGEGPATGQLVRFDITLSEPFELPADRYFFVPQVGVESGEFLWASAPRPIVEPGTPLNPDLQSWIRDENLDPDWLRIGTDVIGAGAFNASFSVAGQTSVPEPSLALALAGFALVGGRCLQARKSA